jgi:four helix bundle protein
MKKIYDLENRLVAFSGDVILLLNNIKMDNAGANSSNQLTRSATSSALNYGEAQGADSTKDKIHKLSISIKELKESRVAIKILKYINYGDIKQRDNLLIECEELIAILSTIRKNYKNH